MESEDEGREKDEKIMQESVFRKRGGKNCEENECENRTRGYCVSFRTVLEYTLTEWCLCSTYLSYLPLLLYSFMGFNPK